MNDDDHVTVTITIKACVPPEFVPHMFEAIRKATPIDGKLVFEVDGR
ncbi:hypothetical protein O5Y58_07410 [Microbacterium paraoxydans]